MTNQAATANSAMESVEQRNLDQFDGLFDEILACCSEIDAIRQNHNFLQDYLVKIELLSAQIRLDQIKNTDSLCAKTIEAINVAEQEPDERYFRAIVEQLKLRFSDVRALDLPSFD